MVPMTEEAEEVEEDLPAGFSEGLTMRMTAILQGDQEIMKMEEEEVRKDLDQEVGVDVSLVRGEVAVGEMMQERKTDNKRYKTQQLNQMPNSF